jgi:hypothetical protein
MNRIRVLLFVAIATVAVGCNRSPAAPSAPPPTPPPLQTPSLPSLRGTVFENTSQGRRPIAGAHVFVVDLVDGPYGDYPWYLIDADAGGHIAVAGLSSGRAVKLTAYVGATNAQLNDSGLSQVCAVHPTVGIDAAVEIDLFSQEAVPRTLRSPVLSGVLVKGIPARPAADVPIIYSSNSHDGADVYTRTDASGRFTFCGLPEGDGYVLPFCTLDTPVPPETIHRVAIHGDTTLNIGCP